MSLRTILANAWRRRAVQVSAGVLSLAAALYAECRLAHVPLPVEVSAADKFAPAAEVRLGVQELVIEGPVFNSQEGLLLTHDGHANEEVDATFDRAQLAPETRDLL